MPRFALFLHGRPVMMLDEKGERAAGGVYAWRSVEAADPEQAVAKAREKLLRDEVLREEMKNAADDQIALEATGEAPSQSLRTLSVRLPPSWAGAAG